MNLLGFLRARRRTKINVINREETRLTLADWQSDPDLVKTGMRVWNSREFRLMIACLRNETPGNLVLPDDAAPHRSVALQRRQEGYVMAIANLEAMAVLAKKAEALESTFEPEENEKIEA